MVVELKDTVVAFFESTGAHSVEDLEIGRALTALGLSLAPFVGEVGELLPEETSPTPPGGHDLWESVYPFRGVFFGRFAGNLPDIDAGEESADISGYATYLLENGHWAESTREGAMETEPCSGWFRCRLHALDGITLANSLAGEPLALPLALLELPFRFSGLPRAEWREAARIIHGTYRAVFPLCRSIAARDRALWAEAKASLAAK
jgi:hypothetical protein